MVDKLITDLTEQDEMTWKIFVGLCSMKNVKVKDVLIVIVREYLNEQKTIDYDKIMKSLEKEAKKE